MIQTAVCFLDLQDAGHASQEEVPLEPKRPGAGLAAVVRRLLPLRGLQRRRQRDDQGHRGPQDPGFFFSSVRKLDRSFLLEVETKNRFLDHAMAQ